MSSINHIHRSSTSFSSVSTLNVNIIIDSFISIKYWSSFFILIEMKLSIMRPSAVVPHISISNHRYPFNTQFETVIVKEALKIKKK